MHGQKPGEIDSMGALGGVIEGGSDDACGELGNRILGAGVPCNAEVMLARQPE